MVMPRNWNDDDYGWTQMPAKHRPERGGGRAAADPRGEEAGQGGRGEGDLGVTLKEDEPGADPMKSKLVVAVVRPGSAAATAGLQAGDEVISVDGQDVTGANRYLYGTLTRVLEGTTVTLGLASGKSVAVVAGSGPDRRDRFGGQAAVAAGWRAASRRRPARSRWRRRSSGRRCRGGR